ncbi:MAG: GIY-YIG nuclease family protein, partial [Selenomonadaceae bacterium]|nr:GIY-YIG nuclease family protein [Selenomonadaceae bacterium]
MVYGIVYLIMNLVNGKKYVGQTVRSLEKRMLQHTYDNLCVDKAMRKYGLENFYYGVVKSCASKEELDYWEKYFIVALKSKVPNGYNLTDGGEGTVGRKHTPETLAKMSASKLGKKRSAETRAKISVSRKGKYTT